MGEPLAALDALGSILKKMQVLAELGQYQGFPR